MCNRITTWIVRGTLWVTPGDMLAMLPFRKLSVPFHIAGEPASREREPRFRGPVALVSLLDGRQIVAQRPHRRSGSDFHDRHYEAGRLTDEISVGKKLSGAGRNSWPWAFVRLHSMKRRTEVILITRNGIALLSLISPLAGRFLSGEHCGQSRWHALCRRFPLVTASVDHRSASTGSQQQRNGLWPQIRPKSFHCRLRRESSFWLTEPDERLIVADAFGGRLAVVDSGARGEIEPAFVNRLAHNIRSLALNADGSRLLVAHQILNSLARTTPDDVHWGMLMGNIVRSLKLQNVLDKEKESDVLRESVVHPVGEAGNAAADPAEIALAAKGQIAVGLAGVGEVGLLSELDSNMRRVAVAGRPAALVVSPDGSQVYAADELRDAISVVTVAKVAQCCREISLGLQPELSVADQGERLFYDGRLSHDGWMSCHSCHTDGHSNGLLNDNLGDGAFGAPKRVLSLLGVGRTGPWAWNGDMHDLEPQIKKSVETTMRGRSPRVEQVQALAAFLKTLPAAPAPRLCRKRGARIGRIRGKALFEAKHCNRCHAPPEYTSPATYDVGLKDELDYSKFNPPSLRGVGQRDDLFHDNRAKSLEDVVNKFKHQLDQELPARDLADLLAFLRSL